jgi:hypothetical protein
LQAERSQLTGGWNDLEAQRRSIARSRQTDSFLAALVTGGGGALAGVLALSFAWLVLFGLTRRDDSAEVACELLVEDLVADRPLVTGDSGASLGGVARLITPADRRAGSSPALPPPTQLDHSQPGETV